MQKLLTFVTVLLSTWGIAQAATITVTRPNGGEDWPLASRQKITWMSSGVTGAITIGLYKNEFFVGAINAAVDVTLGYYDWTVGQYQGGTAAAGTGYRIRIIKSDTGVVDWSNDTFRIDVSGSSSSPPQIQLPLVIKLPPSIASFQINNGAAVTQATEVTLNHQCGARGGTPTHYRIKNVTANTDWSEWKTYVSAPRYSLRPQCQGQTIQLQLKNDYGLSNESSDSITYVFKSERTLTIDKAFNSYAKQQGFTLGASWMDCSPTCTWSTFYPEGSLEIGLGSFLNVKVECMGGMKMDYDVFGGGKLLKTGWEFAAYKLDERVRVGGGFGCSVTSPPVGGRDIRLRVHLWKNIGVISVNYLVWSITLRGPCNEDVSEAFKQQ